MDADIQALKSRLDEIAAARQARLEASGISGMELVDPLRTDEDRDLLWPIVRADPATATPLASFELGGPRQDSRKRPCSWGT
jgi:hypothetical protein